MRAESVIRTTYGIVAVHGILSDNPAATRFACFRTGPSLPLLPNRPQQRSKIRPTPLPKQADHRRASSPSRPAIQPATPDRLPHRPRQRISRLPTHARRSGPIQIVPSPNSLARHPRVRSWAPGRRPVTWPAHSTPASGTPSPTLSFSRAVRNGRFAVVSCHPDVASHNRGPTIHAPAIALAMVRGCKRNHACLAASASA